MADSRIRYDTALLKIMAFFEMATKAKLKDCFIDQNSLLVFVVEPAQYGLAVGKSGVNVRGLEASLKRKIKIVEYSDDVSSFVASLILPYRAESIAISGDVITITPNSSQARSHLIGRAGKNVRNYESIIRRYFPVKELKIA